MEDRKFDRIVVKLSTSVVSGQFGNIERHRIKDIVRDIIEERKRGSEVMIVSSGSIGLGRKVLDQHERDDLSFRQACASIGQNLLMTIYQKLFATHGLSVAQVLVTSDDLEDQRRFENLQSMIDELLSLGVVPIINQNDSVCTYEIKEESASDFFGDNDHLAALIATKFSADLFVLVSSADGILDPKDKSEKISQITSMCELNELIRAYGQERSCSKIQAVRMTTSAGIPSIVCSGMHDSIIEKVIHSTAGEFGTYVRLNDEVVDAEAS